MEISSPAPSVYSSSAGGSKLRKVAVGLSVNLGSVKLSELESPDGFAYFTGLIRSCVLPRRQTIPIARMATPQTVTVFRAFDNFTENLSSFARLVGLDSGKRA